MTKIVNLNTIKRERIREAFKNEKLSTISNIFDVIDNSQFHETIKPKIMLEAVKIYTEVLFDARVINYDEQILMVKDLQKDLKELVIALNGYSR